MMTTQFLNFDPFFAKLSNVDNIGSTCDDRDLYAVYGEMEAYLKVKSPSFACQAGCIQCCNKSLPMVSSYEWQVLHRYIQKLPDAIRARIVHQAGMLRPLAGHFERTRVAAFQAQGGLPGPSVQCPALVDGECTVYEARPFACRAYGYTAVMNGGRLEFGGCGLALEYLRQVAPSGLQLPSSMPFVDRLGVLNEQQGQWTKAYLPQWILVHVKDGHLMDEPMWLPDFRNVQAGT